MFFRFAAGLLLVVLVSMAGVRLEKQTLEMRRAVSVQYYQTDLLLELLVRLRLETQKLTAPAQLAVTMENAAAASRKTRVAITTPSRMKTSPNAGKNSPGQAEKQSSTRKALSKSKKGKDRIEPEEVDRPLRPPLLRFRHPFNPEGID